jgi:CBS domain-containing protein
MIDMQIPTIDRYMTPAPYAVTPTDSLAYARDLMDRHAIHHLPVIAGDELVGVVVAADIAQIDELPHVDLADIAVSQISVPPLSVSSNVPVDEAVELMREQQVDVAIIRGEGLQVAGIFTSLDALRAVTDTTLDAA